MICWNFGFITKGNANNDELVIHGKLMSRELAQRDCDEYLRAAVRIGDHTHCPPDKESLTKIRGLLIVLIDLLKSENKSGMIDEGTELLSRLAGLSL